MTAIPFSTLNVLRRCHDLEVLMEKVYRELAQQHADMPSLSALWLKTAAEERNHASQFSLAMSLGGDVVPSSTVDIQQVEDAFSSASALLRRVRSSRLLPREALEIAISLEERFAIFHADAAIAFSSSSHEKLFHAMMAADKQHVDALRPELQRLSPAKQPD